MQTIESLLELAQISPQPALHIVTGWVTSAMRTKLPSVDGVVVEREMTSRNKIINLGETFLSLTNIIPAVPVKIVDETCLRVPIDATYIVKYRALQMGDNGEIEIHNDLTEALVAFIRYKFYKSRAAADPNKYLTLAKAFEAEFDQECYDMRSGVTPAEMEVWRNKNKMNPIWAR